MTKFKANTTYTLCFIGDTDVKVDMTIIKRTEKSIWIKNPRNKSEIIRKSVKVGFDDVEYILPYGNCSMSPSLPADKPA
ncbi:hypothetical protein [uncultured Kiloniella sp.]|mgnify:FL=1|uniref:hypothetical protein n=1 Tax=uncultured Kiloniella sp. TaxID=1133091 RepID=UPI0026313409|nr:hypothetical protein [uncultured Kiloniella sp.]